MPLKLPPVIAASLTVLCLAACETTYGAWGDGGDRFSGYPQFADQRSHIRGEIRDGLKQHWLDQDQANDLYRSLHVEQQREYLEFREHGWSLPDQDLEDIQASLDLIDRAVVQAREQS